MNLMPFIGFAALAAVAPILSPSGPWVVEAEDSQCLLRRDFGSGDAVTTLVLDPGIDAAPKVGVTVRSRDRGGKPSKGTGSIAFDQQQPIQANYTSAMLPDGVTRLTRLSVDRAVFDMLGTSSTLGIEARPAKVAVELAKPTKGLAALQHCREDLLRSWTLDPVEMLSGNGPRPSETSQPDFYTDFDLSKEDLAKGGRMIAALGISAKGVVEDCRVVSTTSTDPNLAKVFCGVAFRTRFKPATDAAGNATAGHYLMRTRWGPRS